MQTLEANAPAAALLIVVAIPLVVALRRAVRVLSGEEGLLRRRVEAPSPEEPRHLAYSKP